MCKVISPRQVLSAALVASIGVLLFAATAQAETKTWNLASEFALIKQNPAPDTYGHKNVWYYSQGTVVKGVAKYPLLTTFVDPAEEEAMCGVEGFYVWDKQGRTPVILYNSGPTVEEGQDPCDGATFATKTVFMHPEFGGKGRSAVARWKSPITGSVTVSGSVQLVDPNGVLVKGISWRLFSWKRLFGETTIAGPNETHETNLMSFGPTSVSVVKGEYLNLQLGTAMGSNGAYNTTAVSLTITS